MSLYVIRTLEDGATIIGDSTDPSYEVVLKPGQFGEISNLPESEQRQRVREYAEANKTEWARERGPDSPLGRGMEAGQDPETDHGGAEK